MQPSEIFAKRSRERLEDLRWTHAEFAERLGVATSEVTRTLSGTHTVRLDKFVDWARELNCSPEWLLGMEENQSEKELRFSCISALLKIDMKHLSVVRDYLEKMASEEVNSSSKSKKHGSS